VIALGLAVFVLSRATSPIQAAMLGALFGMITFSVYDLTNHATLREWRTAMTLIDIAWGGVSCGLASFAAASIVRLKAPRSAVVQSGSDAAALKSGVAMRPAASCRIPAAAIIAALSVDRCVLGKNTGSIARSARCRAAARSRELADTPPATPPAPALCHFAAANARSISVSTTVA
jgi:hypothetical protein